MVVSQHRKAVQTDDPTYDVDSLTKPLIGLKDPRLLVQQLQQLLEVVHLCPETVVLLFTSVLFLSRLLPLLKCEAWEVQRAALEVLVSLVLWTPTAQPPGGPATRLSITEMATMICPHIHEFHAGLSDEKKRWPDDMQHQLVAQVVHSIILMYPRLKPVTCASDGVSDTPTQGRNSKAKRSKRCASNARGHGGRQRRNSAATCTDSRSTTGTSQQTFESLPDSVLLAWDVTVQLVTSMHCPLTGPRFFEHRPPHEQLEHPTPELTHDHTDLFHAIPCFGNCISAPPPVSHGRATPQEVMASTAFYALQSLQYFLDCPQVRDMLPQHPELRGAVLRHMEAESPYVAAAAAACMNLMVAHSAEFMEPITQSLRYVWIVRNLSDRRTQPDTLALNALPLVQHIGRMTPSRLGSCGLVSVVVHSVHAMQDCVQQDCFSYLELAMRLFVEVTLFPAPLSAAALRADVLGAALKAVKLAWHAEDCFSRHSDKSPESQYVLGKLAVTRMEAVHVVRSIKSMCNMRERPAMLSRLLRGSESSNSRGGGGYGGHRAALGSQPGSSSDGGAGGPDNWSRSTAIYMSLLMRAEENCPGVFTVEKTLADGENGWERRPSSGSGFDAFEVGNAEGESVMRKRSGGG